MLPPEQLAVSVFVTLPYNSVQHIRPVPRFELSRMLCGDPESAHGHRSIYSSEECRRSTRGRSPACFAQDKRRQSNLLAPREPLGGSCGLLTTPGVNSDAITLCRRSIASKLAYFGSCQLPTEGEGALSNVRPHSAGWGGILPGEATPWQQLDVARAPSR